MPYLDSLFDESYFVSPTPRLLVDGYRYMGQIGGKQMPSAVDIVTSTGLTSPNLAINEYRESMRWFYLIDERDKEHRRHVLLSAYPVATNVCYNDLNDQGLVNGDKSLVLNDTSFQTFLPRGLSSGLNAAESNLIDNDRLLLEEEGELTHHRRLLLNIQTIDPNDRLNGKVLQLERFGPHNSVEGVSDYINRYAITSDLIENHPNMPHENGVACIKQFGFMKQFDQAVPTSNQAWYPMLTYTENVTPP